MAAVAIAKILTQFSYFLLLNWNPFGPLALFIKLGEACYLGTADRHEKFP